MDLAALIDLIPPQEQDISIIYRVKPLNRFDRFLGSIPIKTRYVSVKADGFAICSCLQSINLGIPCRHIFAVINKYPEAVQFNIQSIHAHWHRPDMRMLAIERPWINLRRRVRRTDMEENIASTFPIIDGNENIISTPSRASHAQETSRVTEVTVTETTYIIHH
jgi:hypothetical protein